ncbi:MAG: excinuclease ATPase subunit [Comamonas sp.]
MKKIALALTFLTFAGLSHARNDVILLPLQEVVEQGLASGKLDGTVKFYLSGAATPAVNAKLGDDVSNKKTNGVGKTDEDGCRWAALSALIAFESSAKQKGANAVVDMHSFYKRKEFKDAANFECHAGNIVVGVTLKGTYATLR